MFLFAALARRAKTAIFRRVLLYFITMQLVLMIPVAFMLLRTEPYVMYARLHGGPDLTVFTNELFLQTLRAIEVTPCSEGFISELRIANEQFVYLHEGLYYGLYVGGLEFPSKDADFLFGFTPDYAFFRDGNAELAIPVNMIPAWVITDADFPELFNYLAIVNRYFSQVLLPVIVFISLGFIVTQLVMYTTVAWLFGQFRRTYAYMTLRERFTVCVYSSLPLFPFGLLLGFVIPVMHILIFEVGMIYVAYKTTKEY